MTSLKFPGRLSRKVYPQPHCLDFFWNNPFCWALIIWWNSYIWCICTYWPNINKQTTISQKNSGANPLPPLINLAGCQNICSFWFFCLSLLSQHWFWRGGGGFKVFAFDIFKVASVVPLYFLTDCLKLWGGGEFKSQEP